MHVYVKCFFISCAVSTQYIIIIINHKKCQREIGNSHDPLAVAVVKQMDGLDTIVGHVSRRISASCNAFIRRRGIIQCTVTGSRRYNIDLIQGGLEVPCKLRFMISSSQEFVKRLKFRFVPHYPHLPCFL